MFYENHLNSNFNVVNGFVPNYVENESTYTFFADMAILANYAEGEKLKKDIESYVNRMLKTYCKKSRHAYCVMIDSLCLLCNAFYSVFGEVNAAIKWMENKYRDLLYIESTWKKYVTEEEMETIWRELD